MRILWVDADPNPWIDTSGWRVLSDFGVEVRRFSTVVELDSALSGKEFELAVLRVEVPGVLEMVSNFRARLGSDERKFILCSSTWKKDDFKKHSQTPGYADRYAKVPMPPEGFLGLVAELFQMTIEELRDFKISEDDSSEGSNPEVELNLLARKVNLQPLPDLSDLSKKPRSTFETIPRPSSDADSEVLRKYLKIKEEQLEVTEHERRELAEENERIQRECRLLTSKIRESEHQQSELERKLRQADEEHNSWKREVEKEREEFELQEKIQREKLKTLESGLQESVEKYESLKSRVKKDIRRVRANEKELEARLELARKDSETLLQARDQRILEIQRKIDALEFDLDQVQDSRVQAQLEAERYLARLARVSKALNIALSLVEEDQTQEEELDDLEPLFGGAALAKNNPEKKAINAINLKQAPAGAELPKENTTTKEASSINSAQLLAELAGDGDPTQMISAEMHEEQNEEQGN